MGYEGFYPRGSTRKNRILLTGRYPYRQSFPGAADPGPTLHTVVKIDVNREAHKKDSVKQMGMTRYTALS